jgi:uncharacterized protein (TIGR00369 family)
MTRERIEQLASAALGGDADALRTFHAGIAAIFGANEPHLGAHLGIEIVSVTTERVTMRMPWRHQLQRAGAIFHGGAIMALADHVAGCLFNADPRVVAAGDTGLTTDFHTAFLRAAAPGEGLIAEGSVLRRGRNVTFMQIDVRSEAGPVVATCRTTYLTVPAARVGAGRGAGK